MSFFAGFVETPNGHRTNARHPRVRAALRLDRGARTWQSPGHALLAHIQEIATPEDQWEVFPAAFESGRKVLVFDGRLDNREDLMSSLRVSQRSEVVTDGALLAAAIAKWGDEACCHLIGDFAFACWDIPQRRLLLASDQTAGRPIFYHLRHDRLVFATRMDALWGFPGVSMEVDLQCVARLLLDSPPEPGGTAFRDIRQLPAGCRLIWSAEAGMTVSRYWAPDFTKRIRYACDEEYVERARELLDTAVRCRLRSVGPVACDLSGGFDSSGVAATAARLRNPDSLLTVTAVPQPGAPVLPLAGRVFADEWEHASAVAAMHPNIQAHVAPAAAPAYVDPRLLFHARGMPVRNFLNVSWFRAAHQKVRDLGAQVMLPGIAGNLTLSWSGHRRLHDLTASGRVWALRRELAGRSRECARDPWNLLRHDILPGIAPSSLRSMRNWWREDSIPAWQMISALSPELARCANAEAIFAENMGRTAGLDHDRSFRLRLLEGGWRRSGAALMRPLYGFERRDPLGDIRLLEFCLAIPSEQYMLNGVSRRLARRVLADRVPETVLRENRKGRQNPEWFFRLSCAREQLGATLSRLQRSPLASYALDLRRMKNILDAWPPDANVAQPLFPLLVGVLARGANLGEFLEWAEEGCLAPSGMPETQTAFAFALQ